MGLSDVDSDVRARVAGKQAMEARKAWELEAGDGRFRCLREPDGGYVVQARSTTGWNVEVARGADPVELLRKVVGTASLADLVRRKAPPS